MTDTIKPLTSESEQLMTKVTKDLINAAKAFEDSFAKVQKNEQVIKPNDSNWIYAMNNFTVGMYGRLLERTDWHFEQRNKFKQQAEKVVGGTIKAWLHRQEPESRQDIQYMAVV